MPRTIILAASFPAAPERLFDMYLDPETHAAFTGHPVTIAPVAGSPFQAFDGVLSGTMLYVEPKRLIVQKWRSGRWSPDSLDSVLILSFWPEGEGGRIELVHANVPEDDFAGVSEGWARYYWNPWREYLSQRS
jgi:activator of HSP90 ATPase